MAIPGDTDRLVQLRFKPLWLYVDKVREFCDFFARASFEDVTLGERVGLVVHELVENAVKYGDDQELELHIERNKSDVVVCVTNTATPDRAVRLERSFGDLMQFSPEVAYAEALRAAPSLPPSESRLGLPRIRFEARFEVSLQSSPGRVSITARGRA